MSGHNQENCDMICIYYIILCYIGHFTELKNVASVMSRTVLPMRGSTVSLNIEQLSEVITWGTW